MLLDAYVRVSRVGGRAGDSFISPKVQREKIELLARLRGYAIAEWFEDLDEPGTKSTRPGFVRALARVEAGETNGIIVSKLDRFARSVVDAAQAINRIRAAGGQLVSVDDNFDSSTPIGRFAVTMMLAVAELEVDRIRESWRSAQEMAVRRGVHVASRTPTGYVRRGDRRLEPDPAAAPAITSVFAARAQGASLKELAAMLEAAGVVGPYGNAHWTSAAVSKLLHNPVYTGEARSGKQKNPDAHAPIVSAADWRAAQEVRGRTAPGSGTLLSGLLRCAGCRYVLKPDKMKLAGGRHARIYRCRGDHAAGVCPDRSAVMGRVIEPYVVEQFFAALEPDGMLGQIVPSSAEISALQLALDEADAELTAWRDETSIVEIGRGIYLDGLSARGRRVEECAAAVHASLAALGRDLPPIATLRKTWSTLSLDERRRILGGGIDAIMLRSGRRLPIEKRVLILWRGQVPDDFPRRGNRVPLRPFLWPDDDVIAGVAGAQDRSEDAGD